MAVVSETYTVTENALISSTLTYDGSMLGRFNFNDVVSWTRPCSATTYGNSTIALYALLNIGGHDYPVILKRNCSGKKDQILVDELKPLFGLVKMGSHEIRLRGIPRKIHEDNPWILPTGEINMYIHLQWSDYFIFRAFTYNLDGRLSFIQLPMLQDVEWCPTATSAIAEGHRQFFYELQKIWVFRDIFHITNTNMRNVLVRYNPFNTDEKIVPISINEVNIRQPEEHYRKLSDKIERFFFPKSTSRNQVIVRMLGLTRANYEGQLESLRSSMTQIINRINPDQICLVDIVINNLSDLISVYFDLLPE